jgi:cytochrome P450
MATLEVGSPCDTHEDQRLPDLVGQDVQYRLHAGAANRDSARWGHPDQFDVGRKKLPHLGFAFGLHSCLGMNLARLEAQIFLEEWLAAVPDCTVGRPLDFDTNFTVRGPTRVLVSLG